ncbi:MAG: hypothetical protein CMP43_02050 [Rickettsiales bacterium]|jgi:hypothetical protein|nr:hypothetical protein [Rickettsiales bacterium]|tara:strand:+ start:191 stop:412 length:222 start_codon:yes stop_codon:yes gene_type:complete
MSGDGYTIWTHEHTALELSNKVHELSNKIKKIEEINNEDGATALTKQVLIKHIIEGTDYDEPYKSFNVDEGEE